MKSFAFPCPAANFHSYFRVFFSDDDARTRARCTAAAASNKTAPVERKLTNRVDHFLTLPRKFSLSSSGLSPGGVVPGPLTRSVCRRARATPEICPRRTANPDRWDKRMAISCGWLLPLTTTGTTIGSPVRLPCRSTWKKTNPY